MTENVRDAARSGYFQDRKWLTQVDAVFAEMYFDVRDDWDAGRNGQVPKAWPIALKAEDDRTMTGLGNFMLAMNAHINRDFPHVLAEVGVTAADGTSHKVDHNAYNQRLDSLYAPVFAEEAARFDPRFDDIDVSTIEETLAGVIMRWLARDGLAQRRGAREGEDARGAQGRRSGDRAVLRLPGVPDARPVQVEPGRQRQARRLLRRASRLSVRLRPGGGELVTVSPSDSVTKSPRAAARSGGGELVTVSPSDSVTKSTAEAPRPAGRR